jgi:hypothetical protein
MATLAQRLTVLDPQITSLKRVTQELAFLRALRARNQQVSAAKRTLDDAFVMFARLERLGVSVSGKPRASAALRGKPAMVKERLENNAEEMALDSQWDPTLLTPLAQFSNKLSEWMGEAWSALVDKNFQPVKDDLLDQFDRLGFGSRVREVRAARDQIRTLRDRLPTDDATLITIAGLASAIAKALGEFDKVPPAVRAFFAKAASQQQAGLEDLTTEVQNWLRQNDMLKLIRVSFK